MSPRAPATELPVGSTVGRYRILGQLGRGGMGVVYRAEDPQLERQVALKFLPPEFRRDEHAQERLWAEARSVSSLDHPNICTVYEISQTEPKEGDEQGARLFIALLPPFDLVFPDRAAAASDYASEVVVGGEQQRFHDAIHAALARARIGTLDLLPRFREIAAPELYALDYHIWKRGHRLLAEELAGPVRTMLDGMR